MSFASREVSDLSNTSLERLRTMLAVEGEHESMAAVLHDVVEDTSVTFEDLRAEGFPSEVSPASAQCAGSPSQLDATLRNAHRECVQSIKKLQCDDREVGRNPDHWLVTRRDAALSPTDPSRECATRPS